ncbi:MAG: hypothetical protein PHY73_02720 [Candidatus Omnitrophica bacterium]|nr:hypothetical protein [Candidatus Omnitrophota bacterium]
MKRKVIWILIGLIIIGTVSALLVMRSMCMSTCIASFEGAYPEIACKYECAILDKFKKPSR